MTTIEHALFGVNLVLASGLNRRYGWQLAAMSGIAANLPDWDGFTVFGGIVMFDQAHRCWGHALIVCLSIAVIFALLDYRFDLVARSGRFLCKLLRLGIPEESLRPRRKRRWHGYFLWTLVAVAATFSHLLGDIVVSGYGQYADWPVKPFWPFSNTGIVYPLIPWGDAGVICLFFAGLFAMLRWKRHTQKIALLTLTAVACYAIVRSIL
ncbi:MAG: metal-dependent hydrolase [Planctomycetaceae bacterium]|nr:metal-dependent hydrolase [Planctomycetaceae bacterium]